MRFMKEFYIAQMSKIYVTVIIIYQISHLLLPIVFSYDIVKGSARIGEILYGAT